jgi:hypothetical protein
MTTLNSFPSVPSGETGDDFIDLANPVVLAINEIPEDMNAINSETLATKTTSDSNLSETQANANFCSPIQSRMEPLVNYKGRWEDLTGPLNKPACVWHNGLIWKLNNNLTNVASSEPATGNNDWSVFEKEHKTVSGYEWILYNPTETGIPYITTWTVPDNTFEIELWLQGGGASGGISRGAPLVSGARYYLKCAGNAGVVLKYSFKVKPGDVFEFSIGQGGTAVTGTAPASGNVGGTTQITKINGVDVTGKFTAGGGSYSNGTQNTSAWAVQNNNQLLYNQEGYALSEVTRHDYDGNTYYSIFYKAGIGMFGSPIYKECYVYYKNRNGIKGADYGCGGLPATLQDLDSPVSQTSGAGYRGCVFIKSIKGGY